MNELVLAIDFGTTNSLLGAIHNGKKVFSVPLDPGAPDPTILRTLLYFPDAEACFYGSDALKNFAENDMSGRLFRSFKAHLPNRSYLGTMLENRPLPLEEMVGIFLLEMRKRAEKHFGQTADKIVLGRPARYSLDIEADRFAEYRMRKGAAFAGFRNIEFVAEPLAAAFEFRKTLSSEKTVLVADFGGGTSDFTIIKLGPKEFKASDVLALDGASVAGDALDGAVMTNKLGPLFGSNTIYRVPLGSNFIKMPPALHQRLCQPAHIAHLKEPESYEFLKNARQWAVNDDDKAKLDRLFVLIDDQQIYPLFDAIEQSKRALSASDESILDFDYPDIEINEKILRSEFDTWIAPSERAIFKALDNCLETAGLTADQIDLVCCTGGTAKVPAFQNELLKRFGASKMQTSSHFHSVLYGLVEMASRLPT
jgi:hypothetical chaperone protein